MIKRTLNLNDFKQSMFLFGPRQVGKTYLIKNTLSFDIYLDLLDSKTYLNYFKDASLLSAEIATLKKEHCRVIIDEIQRCPELLNEIQLTMDSKKGVQFILTGSSARKLRRTGANLLGGRALRLHLYPLTHEELGELFNFMEVLRFGSIPKIVLEENPQNKIRALSSYVDIYLKEEIQQESITRNIPAFARFLELAAYENGNILNFKNISREVGVHSKTIKDYFGILEDTLLGFMLYPFSKSHRAKLISHPKFYLFDLGVTNALKGETAKELKPRSPAYGRAFEHFVLLETKRLLDYREREAKMSFFRTSDGAEVDLILEFGTEVWAVEIKASRRPQLSDIRGLRSFIKDHKTIKAICACQTPRPFSDGGIDFLPWQDFLMLL
jgi:predicted AAA+ superfamily ATPase